MGKAGKYIGDDLDGLPLGLGQTNPKYFVRKHQKRFKISESKDACWAICFSLHLEITKILRNRSKVQICGADRKDSLRNELLYTHYYIVSIWWQRRPWGALCTCKCALTAVYVPQNNIIRKSWFNLGSRSFLRHTYRLQYLIECRIFGTRYHVSCIRYHTDSHEQRTTATLRSYQYVFFRVGGSGENISRSSAGLQKVKNIRVSGYG